MKYSNGSESVLSNGPWVQLVGVLGAICDDGVARTVHRIGVPDTFFSAPGVVYVGGKTVSGFVTCDESGYKFKAFEYRKNGSLIKTLVEQPK